jgi:hypothetical protein
MDAKYGLASSIIAPEESAVGSMTDLSAQVDG